MKRANAWWYGTVILGAILWFGHSPAWGETLYVQTKTAQLRAGKTSLDSVVGNVRYGEAVEVLSRDGNWTEVKTSGGAKGWIFSSKLAQSNPSGGSETSARLGSSMRSGDASAVTASTGTRGLDKSSEAYADRAGILPRDRQAVARMSAYEIPDEEVEEFLKDGGLGEYAK
ncbi:MAG: SH3 domain-containing protein [Nitrospira sp.]